MRSSSPPRRHLQVLETDQLLLPFRGEAELSLNSTSNGCSDGKPPSSLSSSGRISPSGDPTVPELREPKREERCGMRKPPLRTAVPLDQKLLVSRKVAAEMLTISIRKVDYMIADGRLLTRRIDNRVLIPIEEIRKFARSDHPRRIAG